MPRIPETLIEEIKEKSDFLGIVKDYTSLSRKGGRYWGCCPFHAEKTPSFSVRPEEGMFYCFSCHKGGSLFNFIMEVEGLSFIEAVRFAAEKASVPLPENSMENDEDAKQRDSLKDLYNRVTGSFHYILMNSAQGAAARNYLAGRGIHEDTILRFQLGYAPDDPKWLFRFLRSRNFSPAFLKESGLFSRKYPEWSLFSDRLMFPIYNNRGEVVAFSGRTMKSDPKTPKYINSPETALYNKSKLLYGLWQSREGLRKERSFYLCEGNVDVLALHQAGLETAMAPLGTAFTEDQCRLLKRYSDDGCIVFDSDNAGQAATFKAAMLFEKHELPAKAAKLPQNSDPAEILEKDGGESLKKVLKSSVNLFEYLLDFTMVSYDVSTPEGKEQAVKYLFPYIESIVSDIKRDLCLGTLAEKLGIESKALLSDLNRRNNNSSRIFEKKETPRVRQDNRVTDELLVLMAAALHREYLDKIKNYSGVFDFQDRRAEVLYKALIECEENSESSTESLLVRIPDESVRNILVEKISTGELDENTSDLIDKTLLLIRRRHLQNRSREINHVMSRVSREADSWELVNELIIEKQALDKEIENLKVTE